MKLAISHALAQSSMLTLYEDRIGSLVAEVCWLCQGHVQHGCVRGFKMEFALASTVFGGTTFALCMVRSCCLPHRVYGPHKP